MSLSTPTYREATAEELVRNPWAFHREQSSGGADVGPVTEAITSARAWPAAEPHWAATGVGSWLPPGAGMRVSPGESLVVNQLGVSPRVTLQSSFSLFMGMATATMANLSESLAAAALVYARPEQLQGGFETDYRVSFRVDADQFRSAALVPRRETGEPVHTAARIRQLSGLDVGDLGRIFGVSRAAIYAWMSGTSPRADRDEHLLEVLPLVEETARRLGGPFEARRWLRTPVSPGGEKPVDLLRERDYDAFRGALLRARTGREAVHLLRPRLRRRTLTREELEDGLERLRPRAFAEDPDADDPGD